LVGVRSVAGVAFRFPARLSPPQAVTSPPADQPPDVGQGSPDVRVRVNTDSGVYHCPGTRWYGRTRQGLYMTQREARAKGNRPAYGSVCR